MTDHFRSIRIAACILGALIAAPALAGTAAESVSASEPFVRMVPPGMNNSAAYMTLKNSSDKSHKVIKAESPLAKAA